MEDLRRKTADEIEKDVIFSHAIKAGKRIYYMDVRKTRKDEMYLSITESKKITTGEGEDAGADDFHGGNISGTQQPGDAGARCDRKDL